jgi:hypothetical protein
LSAYYSAAIAPLSFLLDPSAGREVGARAMREKNDVSRQKSCETKGLERDSIHSESNRALSVLACGAGELAANYQDAVKGVLTLSRPATMEAQEARTKQRFADWPTVATFGRR